MPLLSLNLLFHQIKARPTIKPLVLMLLFVFGGKLMAFEGGYTWKLVNNGQLVVSSTEDQVNIQGSHNNDLYYPCPVALPDWLARTNRCNTNANFYLYYSEHHGVFIRMKWAEFITGPWTEYNSAVGYTNNAPFKSDGVMDFVDDTSRNKKHPNVIPGYVEDWCGELPNDGPAHCSAPNVIVDDLNKMFLMSWHGKIADRTQFTDGSYGQTDVDHSHTASYVAFSDYGLNFNDPQTGGGVQGTWLDQRTGIRRPYGPLEVTEHTFMVSNAIPQFTAHISPNEYMRFLDVRGQMYGVGTGGQFVKPFHPDPWEVSRIGDIYRERWQALPGDMIGDFLRGLDTNDFALHPNNPVPGKTVNDYSSSKVNHSFGKYLPNTKTIEVYTYIRGDQPDDYNQTLRIEIDASSDDWTQWTLARYKSGPNAGKVIFDVVVRPEELKAAVEKALGGPNGTEADVDGTQYADPVSMGVPGVITVNGHKYMFVGFNSYDVNSTFAYSEGQIACLELGNVPPVINSITVNPSKVIEGYGALGVVVDANDADNDMTTVQLLLDGQSLPQKSGSTNTTSYSWLSNDNLLLQNLPVGTHTLTAIVTDSRGESNTSSNNLVVNPINPNPPIFSPDPITKTNAIEDNAYSGSIAGNASDADGDTLAFSRVSGPTWLSVATNGSLSGIPLNADVGTNSWQVQVSDGKGGTDIATLIINVINVNDAPVFTIDPITRADAATGIAYSGQTLSGSATDVDVGTTLTYSKVSGPAWLSIVANGALSGTPALINAGVNSWTVQVSDGITNVTATLKINVTTPGGLATNTFVSVSAEDGWVLESSETSNAGGSINATGGTTNALIIGDDIARKQYKSVVSFDTSVLPDAATIISATLRLKRGAISKSPSSPIFGTIYVDIKGGAGFNGATALENGDFEALADTTNVATMSYPSANGTWSTGNLTAGLTNLNTTGKTQLRIHFAGDDNNDSQTDYLGFYSGEAAVGDQPELVVVYNVPANTNVVTDPYVVWATLYGVGGKEEDYDQDGLSNLYEFGVSGNPTNKVDRGIMPTLTQQGNSFRYVHAQRHDGAANYIVETSTNLLSGWTNAGYAVLGTNSVSGNPDYDEVNCSIPQDAAQRFIRLRVTAP